MRGTACGASGSHGLHNANRPRLIFCTSVQLQPAMLSSRGSQVPALRRMSLRILRACVGNGPSPHAQADEPPSGDGCDSAHWGTSQLKPAIGVSLAPNREGVGASARAMDGLEINSQPLPDLPCCRCARPASARRGCAAGGSSAAPLPECADHPGETHPPGRRTGWRPRVGSLVAHPRRGGLSCDITTSGRGHPKRGQPGLGH